MKLRKLRKLINEELNSFLGEVKYINPKDYENYEPIKDSDTIRVYHGFYSFNDVQKVLSTGLSGKEKARRIYSYESGNNPNGLFVSVDFKVASKFATSGVVIEFSTKVSDLEAPIWVGGRSYFVQGEYTKSFKDLDEREQQRLINRQKAGESPYKFISKSDRPELAETIFDNPEKQALYIGDLNPNMIKYVWYNEQLHKNRRLDGEWKRLRRKDFIKRLNVDTTVKHGIGYKANDDFNFDELVYNFFDGDYNSRDLKDFVKNTLQDTYRMRDIGFFPKQIKQIQDLTKKGYFDKYLDESVEKKQLTEELHNVDDDVDLLYNKFFKSDIDEVKRTGMITKNLFKKYETDTSILKNPKSIKTHKLNPCKILINHVGNSYNPAEHIINLSINKYAIDYVIDEFDGNFKKAVDNTYINLKDSLKNDFEEHRIKGSIHHELTHWIDDTLYGSHIKKYIEKNNVNKKYNNTTVNTLPFEINAQIHAIKQTKNKNEDKWDNLTFGDLLKISPSLSLIYRNLSNDDKNEWIKKLKKRMHREGLLGKKMYN